jgi:hypothetical protein
LDPLAIQQHRGLPRIAAGDGLEPIDRTARFACT